MEVKNVWTKYSKKELKEVDLFCNGYRDFLDCGKTERECVDKIVNEAEAEGFIELERAIEESRTLKTGDKVYSVHMNKSVILFRIGTEKMENGMNILGAHIDSPRIDVKQNPLYEENGICYLDTHYYGGIKKYQWVTIPLALHGVVVKKDLSTTIINIGDKDGDPVFFISDLLIHLSQEQLEKKAAKVIEGEQLDLVIGNMPSSVQKDTLAKKEESKENSSEKDAVKKSILAILKKEYGIEEEDFLSAELEIVPAGKAYEAGLDRSMILAYGQDDRVCAYPSYQALFHTADTKKTLCCILVDKEEIGSVGATGMKSHFFENAVSELMNLTGEYSELALRRALSNSNMLSSDVSSAFDPTFASSFDKKNVAYLGKGMVFCKFTGARGKSGSNDANAEYIAKIRSFFDRDDISFQMAELGKVDLGGGGTIAYILARYGMNVIDCGVAVMSMHAPYEVTSKADIYETYRGYKSFLQNA